MKAVAFNGIACSRPPYQQAWKLEENGTVHYMVVRHKQRSTLRNTRLINVQDAGGSPKAASCKKQQGHPGNSLLGSHADVKAASQKAWQEIPAKDQ